MLWKDYHLLITCMSSHRNPGLDTLLALHGETLFVDHVLEGRGGRFQASVRLLARTITHRKRRLIARDVFDEVRRLVAVHVVHVT